MNKFKKTKPFASDTFNKNNYKKMRQNSQKAFKKSRTRNLLEEGGVSTTARTTDQHTLTHTERATYRTMDQLCGV